MQGGTGCGNDYMESSVCVTLDQSVCNSSNLTVPPVGAVAALTVHAWTQVVASLVNPLLVPGNMRSCRRA